MKLLDHRECWKFNVFHLYFVWQVNISGWQKVSLNAGIKCCIFADFSFMVIPSFWTLTDFKDRNIKLIGLVCHHKIPGQLFNCMHTVSLLTWLYLIIGWLIWHMLCYMMSPHLLYCFLKCGLVTKMLFRYIIATAKVPNVPKILFREEIFNFRIK